MKRAFKNLFRKGESNVTKIVCLGVGLAVGLTLLAEVIFEHSYDNFIPRLQDTYQIQTNYQLGDEKKWNTSGQVPGAIAPGIKRYCPEVEAATRFTLLNYDTKLLTEDQRMVTGNVFLCDSSFFEVFPRKILAGGAPHEKLEQANCAYVSARMMERLGNDALGQTLTWKEFPGFRITVAGVFEDFPENTHLPRMDVLVALPTIGQVMGDGRNNWVGNERYVGYVRLRPGTDPASLQSGIQRMFVANAPIEKLRQAGVEMAFSLKGVKEIFWTSDYNRTMNAVFLSFALIMLAVALLNYILLAISSMANRAKSIATCRCYGAGNGDIYRTVLGESSLHCLLGLALAVLLIFSMQDFLQEQMSHSLSSLFPASTLTACLLVTIAIAAVCGFMPGYLYTRIPITYAYRRYTENKRYWKLGLLFVQFLLTTLFVCLLAVISLQYRKLTNYDTGFEYKNILYVSLPGTQETEQQRCVQELKRLPSVESVTWGYQEMFLRCSGNNVYDPATGRQFMNIADMYDVGEDYHKTFGIPVTEGKTFTPSLQDTLARQIMVSRSFVEKMEQLDGWTGSPVGRTVHISEHPGPLVICGVYEDIHLGAQLSENHDERPTVMFYRSKPCYLLYIRLRRMGAEQIREVQQVVTRTMPSQDKQAYSLNLEMGNLYDRVFQIRNSVFSIGGCILVIAMVGLIAYIRDETNRRRAEIAIRIIHGATAKDVWLLFTRDLLKTALPALVCGMAAAWAISSRLLQLFAVKITLTGWLFGLCTAGILSVICLLASFLVWKTAHSNPTENLRTE